MIAQQFTADLSREVFLRESTCDRQVWSDTFVGRYHLPPDGMPEPVSVLDVGANIGLTAAHYKTLWPDAYVVAVELDGACIGLGQRNAPDVVWVHEAITPWPSLVYYDPAAPSDGYTASRYADRPGMRPVHSQSLHGRILHSFGDEGVDFVKLDVEGMEWRLFKQADQWAPLVRYLLVELHDDGASPVVDRRLEPPGDGDLVARAITMLSPHFGAVIWHEPHPHAVFAGP